ncbi:MAG: DNA polymerase-3 subunit gamma/tau [Paracoccaceae bacterium]|jgi:DNA polymerase-3 subunit gamma/tau
MSYQVLARKWRPKTFREMAGQTHVLKALVNALDHDRLHHAYLFTGTRGVGKTTIARILAKCLNCESGVSSEPCGTCGACVAINEGRFVDLIEVDAASKTKVDDTREMLDNVQYTPTRGRYKVYLIDEVHMLSGHSFNALLKTLEEPPPHVKFLLATTDPQKIPATILSRCLQFSLKNMTPDRIVEHLKHVLDKEMISFEDEALWNIARAAEGSMRDALSLTDQAIAFGAGKLGAQDVESMLGSIDRSAVCELARQLQQGDAAIVLSVVQGLAEQGVDFSSVLVDLIALMHRIAVVQVVPDALDRSAPDHAEVKSLAETFPAEDVQYFYQLGLAGRRDLPLAPDARSGFEMVLLRMLAFKPAGVHQLPPAGSAGQNAVSETSSVKKSPVSASESGTPAGVETAGLPTAENTPTAPVSSPALPIDSAGSMVPDREAPPLAAYTDGAETVEEFEFISTPQSEPPASTRVVVPAAVESNSPPQPAVSANADIAIDHEATSIKLGELTPQNWREGFADFGFAGLLHSICSHCVLMRIDLPPVGIEAVVPAGAPTLYFHIDGANANLLNDAHKERFEKALRAYFNAALSIDLQVTTVTEETPAEYAERLEQEHLTDLRALIQADPNVQRLVKEFEASVDESSIQPRRDN